MKREGDIEIMLKCSRAGKIFLFIHLFLVQHDQGKKWVRVRVRVSKVRHGNDCDCSKLTFLCLIVPTSRLKFHG